MNFKVSFKKGQEGKSLGLPMGEGLNSVFRAIGGNQKGKSYAIASSPKVGKSTLIDVAFVIEPCLFVISHNKKIEEKLQELKEKIEEETHKGVIAQLNSEYSRYQSKKKFYHVKYLSYEIDRVEKEFDWACHFLNRDYGIWKIPLSPGKTYKGKNYIILNPQYLKGELSYDSKDDKLETIKVSPVIESKLIKVYKDRIIPLMGEYNEEGKRVKKGMIDFIEYKDNPTGVRNYLLAFAKSRGTFSHTSHKNPKTGKKVKRIIGYKPNNPSEHVAVVTDHIRKLIPERNFTMKQTVDKFSEYTVELRNFCRYSFIHVIHLNRSMADSSRRKLDDDRIYPTAEDIKDTGNLSEDCNYIFTMFNPNDDKYNLSKHFGTVIRNPNKTLKYPNMRTLHLVESRHCEAPQHFRLEMFGNIKNFKQLKIE